MEDKFDLGTPGKPFCNLQRRSLQTLQTHSKGLQSPKCKGTVVRRHSQSDISECFPHPVSFRIGSHRDRAKDQVAVATYILSERLHTHINTKGKSIEQDARSVSVVQR